MSKRLSLIFGCLIITIFLCSPIYADSNKNELSDIGVVRPHFLNISYIKTSLSIDDNAIAQTQTVVTARNVDKIVVNMRLERLENGRWTTLKTWSQSTFGTECILYDSIIVSRGYNYRVFSTVSVFKASVLIESTESISETWLF